MEADLLHAIARSAQLTSVRLSPDGERVAALKSEDGRTELFLFAADASGFPKRCTTLGIARAEHGHAGPDWSPDGRWVATIVPASEGTDITLVEVDTGRTLRLTDGHRSCASPRWSPDGRWVACLVTKPPQLRKLADPPPEWDVALSANDPRHLSGTHGMVTLWVARSDGSAVLRAALPNASIVDFDWRPDSRGLVAAGIDPKSATGMLVELALEGSSLTVRPLADPDGQQFRAPRVSAEGALAYLSDRSGYFEVMLRPRVAAATEEVAITADARDKIDLQWLPDGRLCTTEFDSGFVRLSVMHPRAGGEAPQVITGDGVVDSLSPALRGSRLAFLHETPSQPPRICVADLNSGDMTTFPCSSVVGVVERLAVNFVPRSYQGDGGVHIEGFLALPEQSRESPPPLVVYAHGGPTSAHLRGYHPFLNWLVHQGYAVYAPNFRGSTLYGRAFERANDFDWGGGDLDDVVRSVEVLGAEGVVDPQRAAIFGGSYGGYLTLLALTKRPDVFRCGVSLYAVAHRYSSWLTTDRPGRYNMQKEMGHMATQREAYREASPIFFLDRITAPLLILHGEADARVPFGQSLELVEGMRLAGAFHVFASYEGEGHGFRKPENVADAYARITAFLHTFL